MGVGLCGCGGAGGVSGIGAWGGGGGGVSERGGGGGEVSVPAQNGPAAHPASCTTDTGSLSQGQSGRGMALSTHPHLAPSLKKE